MIKPTVGRVLWYRPNSIDAMAGVASGLEQPLAAICVHVWNDAMVNLVVFDSNGAVFSRTSVPLLQDDDKAGEDQAVAEWIPFQVGQAKKQDAVPSLVETPHSNAYMRA